MRPGWRARREPRAHDLRISCPVQCNDRREAPPSTHRHPPRGTREWPQGRSPRRCCVPTGSVSTRLRAATRTCLRTAAACSHRHRQMRSGRMSGRNRAMVCCSIVSLPTMLRSCFGVRVRLRGQKRVPRPPARTTAWTFSFSFAISAPPNSKMTCARAAAETHRDAILSAKTGISGT